MTDAIWQVQRAIYAHLRADISLQNHLGDPARIYDGAPPNAPLPYLTLGPSTVKEFAGVEGGLTHELTFSVYSQHAGRRDIKQIMCSLYDALHDADFPIDGHALVNIRFVFSDIFDRRDRDLYQGVARFRVVTQPL